MKGIDYSLYPDLDEPPVSLETQEDQADYIHRVCGAWDFGITPDQETLDLISGFRDAGVNFPLPHLISYHVLCDMFDWPAMPHPDTSLVYNSSDKLDALEGRSPDPCWSMV